MTRNLKALGLALVAVFALGAVAASGAMAETLADFHSDSATGNTILTGDEVGAVNEFRITEKGTEGGKVLARFSCPNAGTTFDGTQAGSTATEITVHPVYANGAKECPIVAGGTTLGKAKIETEGCNYKLTAHTYDEAHGRVHIECETGKEIHIVGPLGCTTSFPEQTPDSGIHYEAHEGASGKEAILAHLTLREIHGSSTAACQLVGIPKEIKFADFDGEITVEGDEDEGGSSIGPADIWWAAT